MIDANYEPFPEAELRDLALHAIPAVAPTLRNALLSIEALRDRCLLAETEVKGLRGALERIGQIDEYRQDAWLDVRSILSACEGTQKAGETMAKVVS